MRTTLRVIAIAIAVAAMIDPVWPRTRPADRALVAIVAAQRAPSLDRLRAVAAGRDVDVRAITAPSLPCAPAEPCVLLADGTMEVDIPRDLERPLSLIVEQPAAEPNVELRRVAASSTHASAAGSARVELIRKGPIAASDIRISDGGAVVGTATHTWGSEESASIDVPWWPIQTGARALRIEALPVPGEVSAADNVIDVAVDVTSAPTRVLVFDARPSWASSFARRALEDAAGFTVLHRARIAPSLTAGTAGAQLDDAILDAIGLLIVGGPDALTNADVRLIDRFVRVRGGTLVLLPEQRPSGPAARLFPGEWTEHLSQAVERIGPLYATEMLRSHAIDIGTTLGTAGSMPAIVSVPVGEGRVIVSGAMDSWRYRDRDAGAFDRFWRSLAAEGAAAGAPLLVIVEQPLATRGNRGVLAIRDRRMNPPARVEASATVRCGDALARVIRLWPSAASGEFSGEVPAAGRGSCTVETAVNGRVASTSYAVTDHPQRGVRATLTELVNDVRMTRGVVVNSGDEVTLARAIESDRQPSSQVVSARPMRSPWWIIPFAACLTGEWWLRRRDGLR